MLFTVVTVWVVRDDFSEVVRASEYRYSISGNEIVERHSLRPTRTDANVVNLAHISVRVGRLLQLHQWL
jgi:hypothetical protein